MHLEITGKYGKAVIFTDIVDNASFSQVYSLLRQPFAKGQKIRMMPDIHAGANCTIGTTMTVTDKICPNLVGVDIGCGMLAVKLEEKNVSPENLDAFIRKNIPSGHSIREHEANLSGLRLGELICREHCDLPRARQSCGSLGGG